LPCTASPGARQRMVTLSCACCGARQSDYSSAWFWSLCRAPFSSARQSDLTFFLFFTLSVRHPGYSCKEGLANMPVRCNGKKKIFDLNHNRS
jgi:hypothetical protein